MDILQDGFEEIVRSNLGVDDIELPDNAINNPFVAGIAEAVVKKRVPDYGKITDENDLLFLQEATIAYICYMLVPSLPRRVNIEVQTIDVRWKKDKVDWNKLADEFLLKYEMSLSNITSVEVVQTEVNLIDIIKGTRVPIGGE